MNGIGGRGELLDLTVHLGTEVRGVQLVDLLEHSIDKVAELVAERGVLIFREQEMDLKAQLVVGGRFGPGHLGELTQDVPFEMVDAVLEQTYRASTVHGPCQPGSWSACCWRGACSPSWARGSALSTRR